MARIQDYEMLKTLPLAHVENLWRWHQINDDWFRYYCWDWRNSTPRFSYLYQHWQGKPAPCPYPEKGTNIED